MGDVTIFKKPGQVSTTGRREPTALGKSLAVSGMTNRRIQTNTNGTFKRLINGEQVGNAVRGEVNVIIVGALPKVSRVFYAKQYDPDGEPTLPDCWSNLGDVPEANAGNKQSTSCTNCRQNVKGSGGGERRACRFQRRISVMLEGDPTGDVYQFNIPSKSLFGKGSGNVHPFESYVKFLLANGESPDTVVTNISYDLDADQMELRFTPLRTLTDEEYDLVVEAQAKPETELYTKITVAAADGVKKQPEGAVKTKVAPAKPVVSSDEPDDEDEAPEPHKKRATTAKPSVDEPPQRDLSSVLKEWADDDEEIPF